MKSERRHELKENDLAVLMDRFSAYLQEHGGRLALGVVGVLVAIAVVGIVVRSRAATLEDAWQRRRALSFKDLESGRRSLDMLNSLTETAGDRSFVMGALIDAGRYGLELAAKTENHPDPELNEKARTAFTRLLSEFPENPLAIGAARCGLASVEENAFAMDGDLIHKAKAREQLLAILNKPEFAGMPFYRMATDRLNNIDRIFTVARFVAAPIVPEDESVEIAPSIVPGLPAGVQAERISEDQVPTTILQKVRIKEDGTFEIVDEKQE
ncbi:MAG: hypothetical protein IH897_01100 [Planctomycetes bacterium]|nr:hypothetical protein [Planctomycetota bacterium]